ncbi:NADH-ubiquinone oxidoreductase 14 kDa subunit [Rhizodiscina lignyota]|uniref:NADH-ubiquinone oxidoreductase 14 kDa subunit n=1 Tax=Rhizodiscina lignyota TaxID=1504668 RepID=A0A9P4ILZ4_9PEZI|nr:NADH-ubiquinone oxidoreductase 14 kDa subunit [Rhizodiscina lignyota]
MPLDKVLFWGGFGIAVRLWQLGIEMRPLFATKSLWVYPAYASVGGIFGYWLQGMETSQMKILHDRRDKLLEKRRRQAERDAGSAPLTPLNPSATVMS